MSKTAVEDDGKIFPFSNTGFIYAWSLKVWRLSFYRGGAPQSITCRGNPVTRHSTSLRATMPETAATQVRAGQCKQPAMFWMSNRQGSEVSGLDFLESAWKAHPCHSTTAAILPLLNFRSGRMASVVGHLQNTQSSAHSLDYCRFGV